MPDTTPWTTSYPPGMRWDAELPLKPVAAFLDDAVARWPDKPAIEFMGRVISYRELGELTDRAAQGLQALGVGPGVHVGLYLPNTPHYPIAFFGVLKAGGVVVNYSPLDAERVLSHKVEDSRTDILVTLDLAVLYPQMARILGELAAAEAGGRQPARIQRRAGAGARAAAGGRRCWRRCRTDDRHLSFAQLLANDGKRVAAPSAGRPEGGDRRAAVHRRHHRPAQGRDADARQPGGRQPRSTSNRPRATRRSSTKASSAS